MKKVILRRREINNHLPKEILAGAKISLGSIYVNRQPLKGVTGEDGKKLLEQILDVPPSHQDWPKKEKEFWATMTVLVPFEGKELDITTTEDGFPVNVMDYITYQWCVKHRQVALTEEEMNTEAGKRFYIYDPARDLAKKSADTQVRKDADKEFLKISADLDKMRRLIRVITPGARPEQLSDSEVENQLYDLKNSQPKKFLTHSTDKNLDVRAEIEEMIQEGVLRTIGNQVIYGDEVIGETMNDSILFFNNKKRSGQVMAMRAQLKELKV